MFKDPLYHRKKNSHTIRERKNQEEEVKWTKTNLNKIIFLRREMQLHYG